MLDADDVWLPNRLADTLKTLRDQPKAGLAHGFNDRIDASGQLIDTFTKDKALAQGWVAPFLYSRQLDICCVTVTVRRSCLEKTGLFDETMPVTEDRDLWLRLALQFPVALVPSLIAQYRVTGGESLTTDPDRMFRGQLHLLNKHFGAPGCGRAQKRKALSSILLQRADALSLAGRTGQAALSALRAWGNNPLHGYTIRATAVLLLRSAGLMHKAT
jgi:hypothetical protein